MSSQPSAPMGAVDYFLWTDKSPLNRRSSRIQKFWDMLVKRTILNPSAEIITWLSAFQSVIFWTMLLIRNMFRNTALIVIDPSITDSIFNANLSNNYRFQYFICI
jgi:hypothetical protein